MNSRANLHVMTVCAASLLALTLPSRGALQGGDVDLNFNPAITGSVVSIAVQMDDKVLIGGGFTSINGTAHTNISRLHANGSLDTTFQNGLAGANGTVRSIVLQSNTNILIGGSFTSVNGTARTNIARLNADGTLDSNFVLSVSSVSCIAPQPDGKVIIGGAWNTATGTTYYAHFKRLNADGSTDTNFQTLVTSSCANPFSCTQPSVNSVAMQLDGKVLLGGLFTAVNGITRYHLARVHTNGTLDVFPSGGPGISYQSGFGTSASINSLAVQPDGKVVIGGIFDYFNASPRGYIARLNADGTLDTNFLNSASGADGNVNAIALQSDGKVLLGGLFSHVNGAVRHGIARLNSDGTLDTTFQDGMSGVSGGFISYVSAIALQSDGKVLIDGGFTTVNGVARNGFGRLYGHTPQPLLSGSGVLSSQFGFNITGESNQTIVIEALTNLLTTNVVFLSTNTLGDTPLHFTDPTPPTLPHRFYRARVQ